MVDGQLDCRHDAPADTALGYAAGHATAEREETSYVDVVSLVGRGPLTDGGERAPRHQQQPRPHRRHPPRRRPKYPATEEKTKYRKSKGKY